VHLLVCELGMISFITELPPKLTESKIFLLLKTQNDLLWTPRTSRSRVPIPFGTYSSAFLYVYVVVCRYGPCDGPKIHLMSPIKCVIHSI